MRDWGLFMKNAGSKPLTCKTMTDEAITADTVSVGASRRRFLHGLAAGLSAPALLGTGLALPSLGGQARAQDGEIRFEHAFGTTVLPKPATRVVSIGYNTQDPLLALG